MKINFLSKLLLASMFLCGLSNCQKDTNPITGVGEVPKDVIQTTGVDDRATYIYGVTVWTSAAPSRVVKIDFSTGLVVSSVNVTSGPTTVKDLKGICTVGNTYYVTTGTNNSAAFQYRLLQIDPNTGVVSAVFNPGFAAPISDICFRDVTPLGIYGLKDNSNNPVRINYNAGAWNTTTSFPSLPISPLVASGLCWGKATPTYKIFIAAGDAAGNVKVFNWDPSTLATTGVVGLTPSSDFVGANLGLGYFSFSGIGLINRGPSNPGLNKVSWGPPMLSGTGPFGAAGFNFEDLCTVQ